MFFCINSENKAVKNVKNNPIKSMLRKKFQKLTFKVYITLGEQMLYFTFYKYA